jgi:hypothetical protein
MMLRPGRLLIAVPLAELLAVAGMIVPAMITLQTFDATATARIAEMQWVALWAAPAAGFVFCLLGGWWAARRLTAGHELNGLALGIAVALIELVLLIASGAPFGALYVTALAARIAGGYCGGLVAKRRAQRVALQAA